MSAPPISSPRRVSRRRSIGVADVAIAYSSAAAGEAAAGSAAGMRAAARRDRPGELRMSPGQRRGRATLTRVDAAAAPAYDSAMPRWQQRYAIACCAIIGWSLAYT